MKLADESKYSMEIVSEGTFHDMGYKVMTFTFRVSPEALNDFLFNRLHEPPECFETEEEWRENCEEKDKNLKEWWRRIKKLFGWERDTGAVNQIVSEIFTAVFMEKEDGDEIRESDM